MKKQHWRPDVEMLEPMTLLSGIAGEVHAAASVKVSLPDPLPLIGTMHGPAHDGFEAFVATGSGSFEEIGKVTFKVRSQAASFDAPIADYGSITISSRKLGKLFLQFSSYDGETQAYGITRGTRSFAGESGSGSFIFSASGPANEAILDFN